MERKSKPKNKQHRQPLKRTTRYSAENPVCEEINGQKELNLPGQREEEGSFRTDTGRVISRRTALRHMAAGATAVGIHTRQV